MKKIVLFLLVSLALTGFDGIAQTALEFDGADDYVQTDFPGIVDDLPRTFQAWIYLPEAPGSNLTILDYGVNASGKRNTFMVNGSGYLSYFSGASNGNLTASSVTVPVGEWVHVAFVFDGAYGFLYQNGEQIATGSLYGVYTYSSTNFRIGKRVPGGSIPFDGMIDEVSVWDVALTQQQIIDYACIGDVSMYDGLVVYYDFNDGTGTTLSDLVGGYDGTLMNMDEADWVASDVCGALGYSISFVLTEADGITPVEDALVDLNGEIKFTDADGEVAFFNYDPGTYNYTASKAGYYNETGSVDVVDENVTVDVNLILTGITYDITFVLTDELTGAPVADALVEMEGVQQLSNESGVTVFSGYVTGTYDYSVTNSEYYTSSGSVEVMDDNAVENVALAPKIYYDITFVVTDDLTGDPVENALVGLEGEQQYTNESGETVFTGYLPGTYAYSVTKGEYYEQTGSVEVTDDNVTENVALAPMIYYDITFVVSDELTGTPLGNVLVELDGIQQYTNASGEIVFSEYLPGTYAYTIEMDDYIPAAGNAEVVNENITVEAGLFVSQSTALEFDGTNDYVQTTFPGVLGTTPRTIQAWIWLSEAPASNKTITDYAVNAVGSRNTFMVNGNGYLSYLSGGTNGGVTATVATVPIGSWVHVAFVYDGTDGFLYQNGEQVGTGLLTGVNTPSGGDNLRIGQRVSGGSIPFEGMIDEVSVWDVAFTQQEVIDHQCIDDPFAYDNLKAYYNFNNGTGTTLSDLVGGYNGTLMNMDEADWVGSDICEAGYNISFVVTESDGTTPITNAEVDLDGDIRYTDDNGEVIYYAFDPDTYSYSVSKDGYIDENGTVNVVDDDVTVNVSLVLSGIDYDITFVVTDDLTGNPLEGALVDLEGLQQYTDASGETVFTGYIPESYDFTITKNEYYQQNGTVEVIDADVTENVALAPILYYDITFIVTDESGAVFLENASVEFNGEQQYTNGSGETIFSGYLPDNYSYFVTKDGYYANAGDVAVVDDDVTMEVSLVLADGTSALNFDGVDDYVQTDFPGVLGATQRTIQAWIYLSEAPTSDMCITDYGIDDDASRNTFMVNESGYLSFIATGLYANLTATEATVPIGSWVHVAFTYDGTFGYLYQDGEEVGAGNITNVDTPSGGENFKIGQRVSGGSIPFKGKIDEVGVWNKALTQQEIIDFSCIADPPSIYNNLVAFYDFDEGSGILLNDLVGGNNGTLMNMAGSWVASEVCESFGYYYILFVVTEDDGSTPVENAEVDLDGDILSTDANGEAVYYAYDPGNYNYSISKDGYFSESGTVVVDEDITVDITLTSIKYDITFVVTDNNTANPIENARVGLDGNEQYTDASGETVFTEYLPATYDYMVSMDGYLPAIGNVEVTDEDVTVEVALLPAEEVFTALEFDGVDEYVQTNYPGVFGTDPRSIQAWIYLPEAPASTFCIADYGLNDNGSRNTFAVNSEGYLAYLSGGSTFANMTAFDVTVPVGSWVHVAFVYNGTLGFLYQDGEVVGIGNLTGVNTPSGGENLKIGQRVSGGNIPFNGMIDEVSFWDVALSEDEINDYACVDDPAQYNNLVACFKFNEGAGNVATDIAGGHYGNLLNMDDQNWVDSEVCTGVFNVSFVVTETPGGAPVENALVDLDGDALYTNGNGEVTFTVNMQGTYGYSVSKDGYEVEMGEVEVMDEDVTVEVEMLILNMLQYEPMEVSIYPNPATDVVCIESENIIEAINIYSLSGQLKLEQAASGFKTMINTARLSPGVYCIKVIAHNKVINTKLVIE